MAGTWWKTIACAAVAGALLTPGLSAGQTPARVVPARQAMSTTLPELNVDQVPLQRVMQHLRDVSGTNLVVNWKVLEAAQVLPETPITLQLSGVSLRKALRLVLDQASPAVELTSTIDGNVITVTTQEEADKVMVTRVYVVDDLVMPNNNVIQPPQMDLKKSTTSGTTTSGSSSGTDTQSLFTETQQTTTGTEDTPEKRGAELVTLIQEVVRPNIWRENGGNASIKYFSGKLIVTAPVSVQESIGGPMLPEGGRRLGG